MVGQSSILLRVPSLHLKTEPAATWALTDGGRGAEAGRPSARLSPSILLAMSPMAPTDLEGPKGAFLFISQMKFPFSRHKCRVRARGCRWERRRVKRPGSRLDPWQNGWGAGHMPTLRLEGQSDMDGEHACQEALSPGAGAVVTNGVSGAPRPRGAPRSEYPFLLLLLLTQAFPSAARHPQKCLPLP